MVITAAFNGAGDTATPTVLNLICFWLCQIPLAWALAFHTGLGPNSVYIAVVVSDSLLACSGSCCSGEGHGSKLKSNG